MLITNTNDYGAVEVPLLHAVVDAGETVEVTDEQGRVLLAQLGNWAPADDAAKAVADEHATAQDARERVAAGDPGQPPAQSDPKAVWVAYAETQGAADAASKTKAQLIADHGASTTEDGVQA